MTDHAAPSPKPLAPTAAVVSDDQRVHALAAAIDAGTVTHEQLAAYFTEVVAQARSAGYAATLARLRATYQDQAALAHWLRGAAGVALLRMAEGARS
jgi:ferritin-like metal-binding protein YciE